MNDLYPSVLFSTIVGGLVTPFLVDELDRSCGMLGAKGRLDSLRLIVIPYGEVRAPCTFNWDTADYGEDYTDKFFTTCCFTGNCILEAISQTEFYNDGLGELES